MRKFFSLFLGVLLFTITVSFAGSEAGERDDLAPLFGTWKWVALNDQGQDPEGKQTSFFVQNKKDPKRASSEHRDIGIRPFAGYRVYVSRNEGRTWTIEAAPIKGLTTLGAVDPAPILMPQGDILLYSLGSNQTRDDPARSQPDNTWRILVAKSKDGGKTFVEKGVAYQENKSMTDPFALRLKDGLIRIYISRGNRVLSATSRDGIVFERDPGFRSDRKGGVPGAVIVNDGTVYLFVCERQGIRRLRSSDGMDFRDDGMAIKAPSGRAVCDPHPMHNPKGGYVMAYKEKDPAVKDPRFDEIRLADSVDGRSWTPRREKVGTGSVPGLVIAKDGTWRIYATGRPPAMGR